ncbi:hypothetical protein Q5Y75_21475 [Ruegeria sp. 2205SS24-7]|uniref:hypothetical protein n=1 Tax=Ruegeria discodermiae TaxID=3064389 RepID=UPI002741CFC9|nr:hypothetical protein [Ruegeria sp. 2205SS24-7]MDP5219801.1 hypothetical protein [Ruegeria sp. 2205SS24-7]
MNKSAIEAPSLHAAELQPSKSALHSGLSKTTNSSSGRFPPIENSLSEIIKNKRLDEAKKNV